MTIELRPELEERIRQHLHSNECASVEEFVTQIIETHFAMDLEEFEFEDDDVTEAIAQCDRGESFPAAEVFAEFRAKHGIRD